jgi:hypothetical protein
MLITVPGNASACPLYDAAGFTRATYEDAYQLRTHEAS